MEIAILSSTMNVLDSLHTAWVEDTKAEDGVWSPREL